MNTKTIEQRLQEVEDRVAIKAIVDTFSNLADKKDMASVVQLLTEDADVEFYFGEALPAAGEGHVHEHTDKKRNHVRRPPRGQHEKGGHDSGNRPFHRRAHHFISLTKAEDVRDFHTINPISST